MSDQLAFLDVVLNLFTAKKKIFLEEEMAKYLKKTLGVEVPYPKKIFWGKKNSYMYLTRCLNCLSGRAATSYLRCLNWSMARSKKIFK